MENSQFKSPLFDATASWNGFSYQGKVGIYVCLKLIHDAINRNEDIDAFCSRYSIEFEWLEDFSIIENDGYKSHHQVKHYNDERFSSYIGAIVTILSRQQGRISENDLFNYIGHFSKGETKGLIKKEYIETLTKKLTKEKVIDNNRFLIKSEIVNLNGYNAGVIAAINKYIYDSLKIKEQYSNGTIYFHTSKKVTVPSFDLADYSDIQKSGVKLEKSSKKTLKNQGVLCSFDSSSDYDLALDDQELNEKLIYLSGSILNHEKPHLNINEHILNIYVAQIKYMIDKYVEQRHEDLKDDNEVRLSKKIKRRLPFSEILEYLRMEIVDESSDDYWELIFRQNFENAFQMQIDSLGEDDVVERNNLYRHYKTAYNKYIKTKRLVFLLKELKPHVPVGNNSNKNYNHHQRIGNKDDINSSFLSFLENLDMEHDDCFLFPKNGKSFRASTISVNYSKDRLVEKAIKDLKIDFKDEIISLTKDTDFIVIDSPKYTQFPGRLEKFVEVPNVLGYKLVDEKHIVSPKDITFVHYGVAQEKLNE